MGINLAWVAIQGVDKDALLAGLGFEEVGETTNELSERLACAALPGGWLVITTKSGLGALEKAVTALHEGAVLVGEVSETVMFSRVRELQSGAVSWSVTHDPDQDPDGVQVEGAAPPQLEAIRAALMRQQEAEQHADVDYMFDAPLELAKAVSGYRPGETGAVWSVLHGGAGGGRKPARSLAPGVTTELIPLAESLGWSRVQQPTMGPFEFTRRRGLFYENMHLDIRNGEIEAGFSVWDAEPPDRRCIVQGYVCPPHERVPLWRIITGLHAKPKPPADPIAAALEKGRERLRTLEAFLVTGERTPEVLLLVGLAKATWPDVPDLD